MRRYVASKWAKTRALLQYKKLRPYIPQTLPLTRQSLTAMLSKHGAVYIKPSVGTHGTGVMKVKKTSGGLPYTYQEGMKIRRFASLDQLYEELSKARRGRFYLVQKGINLRTWKGLIFDIRVMVQRSPHKVWEATGLIGRTAHPGKIVTNYHNGGTLVSVEELLSPLAAKHESERIQQKMKRLGVHVAKRLEKSYPGIINIGLDIGLDEKLHPWIIEVNTLPDPYIFRKLKDKRIFAKVIRYHRFNKR